MIQRDIVFGFEDDFQCFSNYTVSVFRSHPSNHWMLLVFVFLILTCVIYNAIVIWLTTKMSQKQQFSINVDDQKSAKEQCIRTNRSCPPAINKFHPRKDPKRHTINDLLAIAKKENKKAVEKISAYRPGGYMPAQLGQLIGPKNRYKIVRKLGFGQYSTVWLSRDLIEEKKYCAIKIIKSEKNYRMAGREEVETLRYIKNRDPNAFGYNHIVKFHDWFPSYSYHGEHCCLAFELMGPSLLHLITQNNFCGLEQKGVKNITKQILSGLVYLHETCNVIHTDIKPENILISAKSCYISNMVEVANRFNKLHVRLPKTYVSAQRWREYIQLYGSQSHAYQTPVETTDQEFTNEFRELNNSCPTSTKSFVINKRKMNIKMLGSDQMFVDPNIHIKIADLGNACIESRTIATRIQTVQYRALEVILGAKYSFPADIWSVACLAFELCTGNYLFNPNETENLSSAEKHLALIWQLLDGIPPDVVLSGKKSNDYFDKSGSLLRVEFKDMCCYTIKDLLAKAYSWKKEEADSLAEFIEAMLKTRPSERVSASGALKHRWLNE